MFTYLRFKDRRELSKRGRTLLSQAIPVVLALSGCSGTSEDSVGSGVGGQAQGVGGARVDATGGQSTTATATGGAAPSNGGATSTSATGGATAAATGGATETATGGSSASTGGNGPATGGSSVTIGGKAAGGTATGGKALGGAATGGIATGGAAVGGKATGGTATGGSATGGVVAGGATAVGGSSGAFPFKPPFMLGADISWTLEDEAGGAKYSDGAGTTRLERIMANNGFNYIRLRTFVCPSCSGGYNRNGFCDTAHTIAMAKRVKACGLGLLVDFHMSDTWVSIGTGADPSACPSAWKNKTPAEMAPLAKAYTKDVITQMAAAGVTPDMVQIGNETNAGMSGIPISNWTGLSQVIAAGVEGVTEVDSRIIILCQNGRPRPDSAGGSNFTGWIDNYFGQKTGTKFRMDGFCGSTYGTTNLGADWKESFSYVINTYKKPVMSCEYTVAGDNSQAGKTINPLMHGFANAMGWGSFIWEPTRYPDVNTNTLFAKSGNTYTTNAAMTYFPTRAKEYGLPVPATPAATMDAKGCTATM